MSTFVTYMDMKYRIDELKRIRAIHGNSARLNEKLDCMIKEFEEVLNMYVETVMRISG